MPTITEDLLKELKETSDIEEFFNSHAGQFINRTVPDYLNEMLMIKDMRLSTIAKNSGEGEYVYKIFKGDKNPSRNVLLAVAFGMDMSLEEAQLLLRISKYAILDSRDMRDSVIIYCLTHGMTVFETDDMLEKKNLVTLN